MRASDVIRARLPWLYAKRLYLMRSQAGYKVKENIANAVAEVKDSATKPQDKSPSGEYIEGFSARFVEFLDRIDFPSSGRYTYGASICSVSVNGFRRWCLLDVAPRTFSRLEDVVDLLLKFKGINDFPTRQLIAWLYFGDELMACPFKDDGGPIDERDVRYPPDVAGFWACLYSYARSTLGYNINLLSPRRREILMRDIKSMASHKYGIKLSAANFNDMAGAEGMADYREKINELIKQSLSN